MNQIAINAQMAGRFKLTRRKADTLEIVEETPWFNNLIVDQGLDRWGEGAPVLTYAKVGASNNPPVYNQTGMVSYIASSDAGGQIGGGARSTVPYYGFLLHGYRFQAGEAAGTLAEIGIGWTNTDGEDIWCRALILDADNNPTTITVLSDEVLDVTYELRLYPNLIDKVFTTVIDGNTYDCRIRAAQVTGDEWTHHYSWALYTVLGIAYNGTLGPITTTPNGTNATNSQGEALPYISGSLERVVNTGWELNFGNLAGGITAVQLRTSAGSYKISFSPPIPKDGERVLSMTFVYSWNRYIP